MPSEPSAIARLRTSLGGYELLTPLGGREARFRFEGPLEGRDVTWEARVLALRQWPNRRRQFIVVSPAGEGEARVEVGLDVPAIREDTVIKTIIMLRQWRRLKPGRHEYGPPLDDSASRP